MIHQYMINKAQQSTDEPKTLGEAIRERVRSLRKRALYAAESHKMRDVARYQREARQLEALLDEYGGYDK